MHTFAKVVNLNPSEDLSFYIGQVVKVKKVYFADANGNICPTSLVRVADMNGEDRLLSGDQIEVILPVEVKFKLPPPESLNEARNYEPRPVIGRPCMISVALSLFVVGVLLGWFLSTFIAY